MTFTTVLYAVLFYTAAAILLIGVGSKLYVYASTPAPLKIPTTPAPTTRLGVAVRLLKEVLLFTSLFRGSKWTWLFAMLFHVGMVLALVRHLRYFTEPVWVWVSWPLVQAVGLYAGLAMAVGLAGLWARRVLVDRVRYISSPSDHLMLALLVGIAASGLAMDFVSPVDIVGLKAFVLGLLRFTWHELPTDPILLVHLTLVIVLMIVFPISKLLHAPGVFFSPTRNQVDNPRERRHLARWARVKFERDR